MKNANWMMESYNSLNVELVEETKKLVYTDKIVNVFWKDDYYFISLKGFNLFGKTQIDFVNPKIIVEYIRIMKERMEKNN